MIVSEDISSTRHAIKTIRVHNEATLKENQTKVDELIQVEADLNQKLSMLSAEVVVEKNNNAIQRDQMIELSKANSVLESSSTKLKLEIE